MTKPTTKTTLPKEFQPYEVEDLIRVGKDNDGGYLIDRKSIEESDLLVTFGVDICWAFEEHVTKINNIPVYGYDGSVSKSVFRNRLLNPKNILQLKENFGYYRGFKKFYYNGTNRFYKNMIGPINRPTHHRCMDDIFKYDIPKDKKRILFSIDIEAGEYYLLKDLIKYADRINALVIEFHEGHYSVPIIREFIKKFPLRICHLNVNNSSGVFEGYWPEVIEISFSRNVKKDAKPAKLPHKLDRPNEIDDPMISVRFE